MLSCWPGRKQRSIVNCLGKSHIARTREWSPGTENDSWKTASKKKGTSVLKLQSLNSAKDMNKLERGFQAPDDNRTPSNILTADFGDP